VKRIVLVAALALLSAGAVQAQNPQPGQQGAPAPGQRGAGRRMAMLMQGLTLSPDQQVRVDSIVARYQAQMPAMTQGSPPDSAAMANRRALMTQQDAEIRAVLTAEQQTIFDRNVETARQNMGRPRP